MEKYRLRVSIMGFTKLSREFEVTENCSFDDLHEAIFDAFDRYDEPLYSFFITRKDIKNTSSIYGAPQIAHPMNREDMGYWKKNVATDRVEFPGTGYLIEKQIRHWKNCILKSGEKSPLFNTFIRGKNYANYSRNSKSIERVGP